MDWVLPILKTVMNKHKHYEETMGIPYSKILEEEWKVISKLSNEKNEFRLQQEEILRREKLQAIPKEQKK